MIQSTSILAYYSDVLPSLGKRQEIVLEEILKSENITNTEISARLNLPINTITPRVFELREKGLVVEARKRICKITGKTAIAWKFNRFFQLENSHYKPEVRNMIIQNSIQPTLI